MKRVIRRRRRHRRPGAFGPGRCRQERVMKRVVLWWLLPLLTGLLVVLWRTG